MSLTGSVVGGLVGGEDAYVATERISNGGFASSSGWTINNAAWQITGGIARTIEGAGGSDLRRAFTPIMSGKTVTVAFDCVGNTFDQVITVELTLSGTVVQEIYSNTPPSGGPVDIGAVAQSIADGIRFAAPNDAGVTTIDNVSLIA